MGRWTEQATWVGPTPNQSGPMTQQRGLVLHVMQGSLAGSVAWAKNPASQVSFHFGTSKAGVVQQLVDTSVTAWTQSAGNGSWLSVENEDYSGNPLSGAQIEGVARLYARGVREYNWPYALANSPSGRGLGFHAMGGVAWGNHPDCPGQPIIDQRPAILARAQQINNGGAAAGKAAVTEMIGLRDPEGGEFTVSMSELSETGYVYTLVVSGERSTALQAGGVIMVQNGTRPTAFGPSVAEVRAKLIHDIAAAVVAALPPASGGSAPTIGQIATAVRAELDRTKMTGSLGL